MKKRITEKDYIKANRKAAREAEIAQHGKQVSLRPVVHKSKKEYNRKSIKADREDQP